MTNQHDSVELRASKKLDGTTLEMEGIGDGPDKGSPTVTVDGARQDSDDGQNEEKEEEAMKEDGMLVEDGVIYDDSDWAVVDPSSSRATKKDLDPGEEEPETYVGKTVIFVQRSLSKLYNVVNNLTKGQLVTVILLTGYTAYFIAAMLHERLRGEKSIRLLWATGLYIVIKSRIYWLPAVRDLLTSINSFAHMARIRLITRWALYVGLLVVMVWVMIEQGIKDIRNIQPIPGLIVMLLICLFFSTAPSKINWHTVYWSIGLQFICAILVLRTKRGGDVMIWVQDRFDQYFKNTEMGAVFLFGESYRDHYIVFGALPTILFSNATLCLLYYLGAIQLVIKVIGSFLEFVLDTSPIESSGVAGGIFLEGVMAFLSLKPYLGRLTKSQLFLLTTSAYASLGGAYLGMLSNLGVKISDLIPAMLMSAPATFTVCKLIMPETGTKKEIKIDSSANEEQEKNNNILEVVQNGAVQMLYLVGNIVAIIFVTYAFLSWTNHTLEWFGERVGVDGLTLELVLSYALYPLSLAMGIEFDDCKRVATILGYRMASGNIIAFQELGKMTTNRELFQDYMERTNYTGSYTTHRDDITFGNQTLVLGYVSERSERMLTYSLCGFSSIVSVGISIGIVSTLIPRRKVWLSKLFFVSVVAGNLANCMTGAFAGLFYYE